MKDAFLALIGSYVPFDTLTGSAAIDWPWVFSALLFIAGLIVSLWFACRLLVGVLRHDK